MICQHCGFPFEETTPRQKTCRSCKVTVRNLQAFTKRERIAAMALQGLLANPNVVQYTPGDSAVHEKDHLEAYARVKADALLAELAKEKP
jgi:hypothetical protein